MINNIKKVFKVLSKNDTGETHSHQSGISIPMFIANSYIFPILGIETLNPRCTIFFKDDDNEIWAFQYIYYNDYYFGKPKSKSHNEYRLTCVREYIKKYGIVSGDTICFSIAENGERQIKQIKQNTLKYDKNDVGDIIIELGNGWKTIKI